MTPQKKEFIIGRDPTVDSHQVKILIDDPTNYVSRSHCKVSMVNGELFLEDLKSRNGTYYKGNKISSKTKVYPNDVIGLGQRIKFELEKLPTTNIESQPVSNMEYANWGQRFIGFLVDGILLAGIYIPIFFLIWYGFAYIANQLGHDLGSKFGLIIPLIILLGMTVRIYYIGPLTKTGQSWGKKIANIKVVSADDQNEYISIWQGWGRFLGYGLSVAIGMIGFFMPLFTARKQAFHDLLAGTVVLKMDESYGDR